MANISQIAASIVSHTTAEPPKEKESLQWHLSGWAASKAARQEQNVVKSNDQITKKGAVTLVKSEEGVVARRSAPVPHGTRTELFRKFLSRQTAISEAVHPFKRHFIVCLDFIPVIFQSYCRLESSSLVSIVERVILRYVKSVGCGNIKQSRFSVAQ